MEYNPEQLAWWREWYYYAAVYIAATQPHTVAYLAHRYAEGVAWVVVLTEELGSYQTALQVAEDMGHFEPSHRRVIASISFEVTRIAAGA